MSLRRLRTLSAFIGILALQAIPQAAQAQSRLFGGRNYGRDFRTIMPNTVQTERDTRRTDASTAYQRRDYAKTLEIAAELLTTDPNDFVALHLQAAARIEVGINEGSTQKVRDGIEDARRSLGIAGQRYAWLYVPYIYGLSTLALMENRAEHADLALKVTGPVLARAGLSKNDRGSLLYQQALCWIAKKANPAAIDDLTDAIKSSPDLEAAYLQKAELLAEMKQIKQATEAYDAMVHTFPNSQLAYNHRGRFYRDQKNLEAAMIDFSQALRLLENESDYINRGMCLLESNDPLAAEGDFTQALRLNSKLDFAYRLRGNARVAHGQLEEGLKDFEAALRLTPNDLLTLEERGFARFFKKDYAGAAADFDKVLTTDASAFRLAQWLYLAYLRAGKRDEATKLLDSRLKGKIPTPTWQATMCSYLQDRTTEQQLLEATKEPNNIPYQSNKQCEAHFFIGQRKALVGATEEAKAHFTEAEKQSTAFSLSAYRGARYELGTINKK